MDQYSSDSEGQRSFFCSTAMTLYGLSKSNAVRSFIRRLVLKLEGGPMYSLTAREIFRQFHGVDVGMYTLGPCEAGPERFKRETEIGRYSSIYWTARVIGAEEDQSRLLKGLQFKENLNGDQRTLTSVPKLSIGHDVFLGHNSIILPTVERIGDGAFIGAGSVVHQSIPPFGVVTGNPARVVRYRFSKEMIPALLEEKWWLQSLAELRGRISDFQTPVEGDEII